MTAKKLIIISGVSRGLGRAMALGFHELGHIVVGCARSESSLSTLVKETGCPENYTVVDVTEFEQVNSWVEAVLSKFGPPDILINNAALVNENAPLWEVPQEEFSSVIDVNIKGVYNLIANFVPAMVKSHTSKKQSGVIVNFSSGWGRSVSPDVAPYCATKWAIEGMTKALAEDLPKGMCAVPLNPGIIDTDMLRSSFGSSASDYPTPDEWAEKAVPMILKLSAKDNGKSLSV